jgi:hypothetical protein
MRYCNQTWFIASLYRDPSCLGHPAAMAVTVTVTKKIEKWFMDNN